MHRTEVELDSLSDADRPGTKNKYLFPAACLLHFILTSVYGVIIWRSCRKLCRTGIYHLVGSGDSILVTHIVDLTLRIAGQSRDHIVRKFHSLGFFQCFC